MSLQLPESNFEVGINKDLSISRETYDPQSKSCLFRKKNSVTKFLQHNNDGTTMTVVDWKETTNNDGSNLVVRNQTNTTPAPQVAFELNGLRNGSTYSTQEASIAVEQNGNRYGNLSVTDIGKLLEFTPELAVDNYVLTSHHFAHFYFDTRSDQKQTDMSDLRNDIGYLVRWQFQIEDFKDVTVPSSALNFKVVCPSSVAMNGSSGIGQTDDIFGYGWGTFSSSPEQKEPTSNLPLIYLDGERTTTPTPGGYSMQLTCYDVGDINLFAGKRYILNVYFAGKVHLAPLAP